MDVYIVFASITVLLLLLLILTLYLYILFIYLTHILMEHLSTPRLVSMADQRSYSALSLRVATSPPRPVTEIGCRVAVSDRIKRDR